MAKKSTAPATQQHLDVAAIREEVVVLRDGTLRAVLAVSSTNFALKSEDEQKAIVMQYVQFLNAIDFPLQIIIHSRKLDIDPYLTRIQQLEKVQANELLRTHMADYRSYVAELVKLGDIMTKSFYVVVPYSLYSDKQKGFFARMGEAFSPAKGVRLKEEKFRERRAELLQRLGYVQTSLQSLGLQSIPLDTQALIELFYRLYNPESSRNEKLAPLEQLQVEPV